MYSGHLVFPSQVMTLVQCFCNTPATELFERCPEANRRSIQKLQEIFSHIAQVLQVGESCPPSCPEGLNAKARVSCQDLVEELRYPDLWGIYLEIAMKSWNKWETITFETMAWHGDAWGTQGYPSLDL